MAAVGGSPHEPPDENPRVQRRGLFYFFSSRALSISFKSMAGSRGQGVIEFAVDIADAANSWVHNVGPGATEARFQDLYHVLDHVLAAVLYHDSATVCA
jgi:hypothetical protein